ncbi:unnamed protein product [Acanthosepion pharaonis]|uniref:Uncharacterized protein n=1 Tax=Acanthosepion pharaonis TaxID=158019 RepID=A0A812CLU1_ACAPH|nr:unnamed protein product [Sepia pharaonis]
MVYSGLRSIPKFLSIRLSSGPPRGGGQQRGFLISSRSHFWSGGPSGWDGAWMIAPFHSTPLSLQFISILRAFLPLWGQRSCSNWGHPASYSFMGDPAAFPGLFAFLVGGNSALVNLMPNLQSPVAVHHRTLCAYSPQVVQLAPRDLGSPPQLVGQSRAMCPAIHTASPILVYSALPPIFLYFFFRVPCPNLLLLFPYLGAPEASRYATPYSVPKSFTVASCFNGRGQGARSILQDVTPQLPIAQRIHILHGFPISLPVSEQLPNCLNGCALTGVLSDQGRLQLCPISIPAAHPKRGQSHASDQSAESHRNFGDSHLSLPATLILRLITTTFPLFNKRQQKKKKGKLASHNIDTPTECNVEEIAHNNYTLADLRATSEPRTKKLTYLSLLYVFLFSLLLFFLFFKPF